jgi:hypothetical protein
MFGEAGGLLAYDLAARTCTGAWQVTSIRSSRAPSPPTFRSSSRLTFELVINLKTAKVLGLRSELLRAREDLEQEREKVAYLTGEIAALRKRLPTTRRQAAAPTVGASRPTDPLERFMEALQPH